MNPAIYPVPHAWRSANAYMQAIKAFLADQEGARLAAQLGLTVAVNRECAYRDACVECDESGMVVWS